MAFKILSWNINGLRSFKTDMKEFLLGLNADIICFQETKITRDMLEEPLAIVEGFSSYFSFCKKRSGYSGVATYCSKQATPIAAQDGLSGIFLGELSDGIGTSAALCGSWSEKELKDLDSEGRAVITQHTIKGVDGVVKEVCIINVYCPRVDPEKPDRREFKLRFYELVRQRAAAIRASGRHVIILGDINTSHRRIDHCDPDESEDFENRVDRRYLDQLLLPLVKSEDELDFRDTTKTAVESDSSNISQNTSRVTEAVNVSASLKNNESCGENHTLTYVNSQPKVLAGSEETANESVNEDELLKSETDLQVVDTFRYFYPKRIEAFTCWNTLTNARSTNYGTRIDYILCDGEFLPSVQDSLVLQDVMGSDHCPVAILVEGVLLAAPNLPQSCTKFFPEFRGEQQKLSSYFQQKSTEVHSNSGLGAVQQDGLGISNTNLNSVTRICRGGSLTTSNLSQTAAKRKLVSVKTKNNGNKKSCKEKQTTLKAFFKKNDQNSILKSSDYCNSDESEDMQLSSSSGASSQEILESQEKDLKNIPVTEMKDKVSSSLKRDTEVTGACKSNQVTEKKKFTQNSGWGFLMKTPAPPPLCPGHREPCVLQTVKKKGPNINKQFYACARGVGKEGDPNARCKFFKWVGK